MQERDPVPAADGDKDVSTPGFDLSRLLDRVSVPDFFASYWERRHRHVPRGYPTNLSELMTAPHIGIFVSDTGARYPAIELAKGSGYLQRELTRGIQPQ